MRIAGLDDYRDVALRLADWSPVTSRAEVQIFRDHLEHEGAVIARQLPFDALCVMREQTSLSRSILERLPNLKLIASTGARNASINTVAASERGIQVVFTGYRSEPTIQMTWALILASMRALVGEANSVRNAYGSGPWMGSSQARVSEIELGCFCCGPVHPGVAAVLDQSTRSS